MRGLFDEALSDFVLLLAGKMLTPVSSVFNTDAMRMLEWLTPSSVDGLTSRIKEALSVSPPRENERSKQQP